MEHHDIAIIGGGIAGVALAYHLAVRGHADVVLLEQNTLGSGATGSSFGGLRQQFSTPLEVRLANRGLLFWKTLESTFGHACPYHEDGYLIMTGDERAARRLEEAARLQESLGSGPIALLGPEELGARFPWIDPSGLLIASWTPEDGRVTATDGLTALQAEGAKLGVAFREHHRVERITRRRHGFCLSGSDPMTATITVVAANYWSPSLLRPWGVHLDIGTMRVHSAITEPALSGYTVPLCVDLDSGLIIEREGAGLLLCMLQAEREPFRDPADMLEAYATAAGVRAPSLMTIRVAKTVTAIEETATPSGHPYAGEVVPGLWVLAGFGGHGVLHGPPLAEIVANAILGRSDSEIDLDDFYPGRRTTQGEWIQLVTRNSKPGLANIPSSAGEENDVH
jgi:sarcosine oxidase subunit beta